MGRRSKRKQRQREQANNQGSSNQVSHSAKRPRTKSPSAEGGSPVEATTSATDHTPTTKTEEKLASSDNACSSINAPPKEYLGDLAASSFPVHLSVPAFPTMMSVLSREDLWKKAQSYYDMLMHRTSRLSALESHLQCAICTSYFNAPYKLDCGHVFCYKCILAWFDSLVQMERARRCPTCRADTKLRPRFEVTVSRLMEDYLPVLGDEESKITMEAITEVKKEIQKMKTHPFHHHFPSEGVQITEDVEDGVSRCARCHWEIFNGICEGCGHMYGESNPNASSEEEEESDHQPVRYIIEEDSDLGGFVAPDEEESESDLEGFVVGDDSDLERMSSDGGLPESSDSDDNRGGSAFARVIGITRPVMSSENESDDDMPPQRTTRPSMVVDDDDSDGIMVGNPYVIDQAEESSDEGSDEGHHAGGLVGHVSSSEDEDQHPLEDHSAEVSPQNSDDDDIGQPYFSDGGVSVRTDPDQSEVSDNDQEPYESDGSAGSLGQDEDEFENSSVQNDYSADSNCSDYASSPERGYKLGPNYGNRYIPSYLAPHSASSDLDESDEETEAIRPTLPSQNQAFVSTASWNVASFQDRHSIGHNSQHANCQNDASDDDESSEISGGRSPVGSPRLGRNFGWMESLASVFLTRFGAQSHDDHYSGSDSESEVDR
ncbi:hypothetical protein DFS34DRAFT_691204 [Phlyctochytrium arcticum]|nr:hypothetical protein DFS34DRAFT_691204 [Phlyctochytrium arcticum]